jgi:predicted transcriptional regulator of viral defense system
LPQYAGGLPEIAKALQSAVSGDSPVLDLLLEYAERLKNGSLCSRLGYLLELLGQPAGGLKASSGPARLDPGRTSRGQFNKRWQLYVNVEPDELFPAGVV